MDENLDKNCDGLFKNLLKFALFCDENGKDLSSIIYTNRSDNKVDFMELLYIVDGWILKDSYFLTNEEVCEIFESYARRINQAMQNEAKEGFKKVLVDETKNEYMHLTEDMCYGLENLFGVIGEFYKYGYLRVEGNKTRKVNIAVEPDSEKSVITAKRLNHHNLFEGAITKDGVMYTCFNIHETMLSYLSCLGIDLSGAVRVQEAVNLGKFNFSSFVTYVGFESHFEKDDFIVLSDKQAKTMESIVNSLKKAHLLKSGNEFEDVLLRSDNLGWNMFYASKSRKVSDFNLYVAKKNTTTLGELNNLYFDGDAFYKDVVYEYRSLCSEALRERDEDEFV